MIERMSSGVVSPVPPLTRRALPTAVGADPATVRGVDPANVRPFTAAEAETFRQQTAFKGLADKQVMQWGYLGQLANSGGVAAINEFHSNLAAYLKTTKLMPVSPTGDQINAFPVYFRAEDDVPSGGVP
jgi:hypothetical protein